jgi:hypothetical protein
MNEPIPREQARAAILRRPRAIEPERRGGSVDQFTLTESLVRGYLQDIPGKVRCAVCLARELYLLPGAIVPILVTLADRQPLFAAGRCGCGANGLMFLLR